MSVITKQDVLKAFYQFDKKNLPIADFNGKFIASKDVSVRKSLCEEWLNAFCTADGQLFAKAVQLALEECDKYPDIDQMISFLCRAETTDEEPVISRPVKPAVPKTNLSHAKKLEKMIELAKRGEFKQAATIISCAHITDDEIICYAKEYWPNVTLEWVRSNEKSIKDLIEQERKCAKCMNLKMCRTRGYKLIGRIDKYDGSLYLKMQECPIRRMENNDRL